MRLSIQYKLVILASTFISGTLFSAEPPKSLGDHQWRVSFALDENLKVAEVERNQVLALEFAHDGRFQASLRVSERGATRSDTKREGVFTQEEFTFALNALNLVDLESLGEKTVRIGYGTSLHPGWQGSLEITAEDKLSAVTFSSLRPDDGQARTAAMNKLATAIFDLKRLAEQRFDEQNKQ